MNTPCVPTASLALLLLVAGPAPAQQVTSVQLDFESGPLGLFVPKMVSAKGWHAGTSADQAHAGQRCLRLHLPADQPGGPFGNAMCSVDATPL